MNFQDAMISERFVEIVTFLIVDNTAVDIRRTEPSKILFDIFDQTNQKLFFDGLCTSDVNQEKKKTKICDERKLLCDQSDAQCKNH